MTTPAAAPRRSLAPRLLLILGWSVLLAGSGFLFLAGPRWDYRTYYHASLRLAEGGPLYLGISGTTYVYPPLLAQVLAPVSRALGWDGLAILWLILDGALLLLATVLVARLAAPPARRTLIWALPIFFTPVIQGIWVGQVSFIMLAGLAGVWAALRTDRRGWGGALLALLTWLKVYPALLGLLLLWRRDWRAIRGALIAGIGLGLLQMLISGPALLIEYFTDLLPRLSASGQIEGLFKNSSVLGFTERLFTSNESILPLVDAPALAGPLRLILTLAILGVTIYAITRRPSGPVEPDRFDLEFSLGLVTALVLGATLWVSGMAPLLLAYGLLLIHAPTRAFRRAAWLSFGITSLYFPLLLGFQVGSRLPALVLSIGFYGVIGLWGVLAVALIRRGEPQSGGQEARRPEAGEKPVKTPQNPA